ncbi:MAG TPA: ABC transporter permease [Burkholderiaceae bacterium]|nr:ABC transporter permease [Burkholderiaceae bacterium]
MTSLKLALSPWRARLTRDSSPTGAIPAARRDALKRWVAHAAASPTWMLAVVAIAFVLVPLGVLVAHPTFDQLRSAAQDSAVTSALLLSCVTTGISTMVVIVLGGALAYLLARHDFRGKALVDTLVDLPMVLPPTVMGIALLIAFGRNGVIGRWLLEHGISMSFTTVAVVFAQVFVALPFFVRAARAAFEGIDLRLETAARLLGASRWRLFFKVTVPLVWPTLLAGAILAWARCLGEFGATIVFAGNIQGVTQTMPLAIYAALQDNLGAAFALSLILLGASFAMVLTLKLVLEQNAYTNKSA